MEEQQKLYNQGRTTPGDIVTRAKPGQSAHNFGLAADIWPYVNGEPNWKTSDGTFKVLADMAIKMGLTAGYYFKSIHDACHVEDPSWKQAQAKWLMGGKRLDGVT